jgi:mono/diheme cytochrome c family protein
MKWLLRGILSLLALALLALTALYVWSGMIIGREYGVEPREVALSSRPEVIAHGERIAQVFGCFHGCHGADMEGSVFIDSPLIGRIIAPNLTAALDRYSHREIEAIVRQGVRPDGSSVFGMPSAAFSQMSDRDLSAILSFIADYPKQDQDLGYSEYGVMARILMVSGEVWPEAAAAGVAPWREEFRQDPLQLGEYLAILACSECHGQALEGDEGFTPHLAIARAYSPEAFSRLMATGVGLGGRDLGLMSKVAQNRFSHLTEDEVLALHAYLQTL